MIENSNQDLAAPAAEQEPARRFKGYWVVLGMAILIAIAGWIIWQGAPRAS
ncbi:MAG: hypothetical protein ACYTG5_12545 [Planctomycetota bacterium]|jgi:hypothetical protein